MQQPILWVFSISHYCEKARWALDYLGIDYQLKIMIPGPHLAAARKHGLRRGSLPILQLGDEVIQGSSAIIDWAEANATNGKSLACATPDAAAIEQRLDDEVGVHVRRLFYSEALVEQPQIVKPVFMKNLGWLDKLKLQLSWPMVRKKMIQFMDLGKQQGDESQAILEAELDWLDGLLADGRRYLVGEQFSRVDITAASLLARIVVPDEYPTRDGFSHPPRLSQVAAEWRQRPALQWVLGMYAQHR
ncbi:MAG: glutathione S-transferase [Gammaproteobacteria bacterium]|nr:glutathione S-transferase [Gammaproteobacteria bacterium]